jgi:hypothetical protein
MNREAVSCGLYAGGHRSGDYLRACGNVYFIDIDAAPADGETPYWQQIERTLKERDISFASVPSKSADRYPYKRHIAVILDGYLPTGKKAFGRAARYMLETLGIDESRIDRRVAFNNVAFLAPARINPDFTNADDVSRWHDGTPMPFPAELHAAPTDRTAPDDIDSARLIRLADGRTLKLYEAKKLLAVNEKQPCFCPVHDDANPSAVLFRNANGITLFCSRCGPLKINTDFIPSTPSIPHADYRYSIVIENDTAAEISRLRTLLGECTAQDGKRVIWAYSVAGIEDIGLLLRAKMWLTREGYSVAPYTVAADSRMADIERLRPVAKNVELPKVYMPKSAKTPFAFRYWTMRRYVFNRWLFVEAAIYATWQNLIDPARSFADTCNMGIAFFEHVTDTIEKQRAFMQKDKSYPMRLDDADKAKLGQRRTRTMDRRRKAKTTARQKKLLRLLNDDRYIKANGKPNITAIAKKLGVGDRHTVYSDLKALGVKP